MRRLKNNKNGFTLPELLVVVALIGTVLAVGYQLLFFGYNSFNKGETQSIIQNDIRTASNFITKEIRNAIIDNSAATPVVFTLESGPPATRVAGYCYIYLENSKIYYAEGTGTPVAKTGPIITEFKCSLKNSNSTDPARGTNYFEYTIVGKSGSQSYDISSEVVLNNITGLSGVLDVTNASIRYKKP